VDTDDAASLALHRNRGLVDAGRLTGVGFKHGRWLDTVLLQRSLP
jgi:phosphinothricin acetyltransferase